MRDSVPLDDCGTVACSVCSQTGFGNAADAEHGLSAASQCVHAINGKALGQDFDGTVLGAFGIVLHSPLQKPSYKTVQQALL